MQGNKLATIYLVVMFLTVTAGFVLKDVSELAPTIGILLGVLFLVASLLNLNVKRKEKS